MKTNKNTGLLILTLAVLLLSSATALAEGVSCSDQTPEWIADTQSKGMYCQDVNGEVAVHDAWFKATAYAKRTGISSPEQCQSICAADSSCFAWMWQTEWNHRCLLYLKDFAGDGRPDKPLQSTKTLGLVGRSVVGWDF